MRFGLSVGPGAIHHFNLKIKRGTGGKTWLFFSLSPCSLFCSTDMVNYLYLAGFPSHAFIKYFVQSYSGQYACVTDNEEVFVLASPYSSDVGMRRGL